MGSPSCRLKRTAVSLTAPRQTAADTTKSANLIMGTEKFCLRWNDFESNISSTFRELRDDKDFFDVTLACDDEQIQAHKVILSACSPFFRNIFRRNPHQHPLLYLKGVKYTDLQSVLNFMYHGEVNVTQEELNSFLAVAEDLRVKGLTQNKSVGVPSSKRENSHPSSESIKTKFHPPTEREAAPIPKRPRPPPLPIQSSQLADRHVVEDDDIQEVVPVKSEPRDAPLSVPPTPVPIYAPQPAQMTHALAAAGDDSLAYQETYEEYDQYVGEEDLQAYDGSMVGGLGGDGNKAWSQCPDGVDQQIESLIQNQADGGFLCVACGYCNTLKYNMKKHIETHIETPGYLCNYCKKQFKTKNSLNTHTSLHHREERRKQ